jgi:hemolysin activation/secretion protein
MQNHKCARAASLLTGAVLLGFAAAPLSAQQVPGTVAPGRIEQQFQGGPIIPPPSSAPVTPRGLAPAEAPPGADKVHFILQRVQIEGATVFQPSDFAPLYQDFVGKDVTLAQMYQVAAAITAKYGSAGYVLSQALVPAQQINGGIVRLQVVEGYVAKVTFRNDSGSAVDDSLLAAYGAKLSRSQPLTAGALERYLLLMNDLPGVSARALMQPSITPGAADLVVVIERKLYDGLVGIDNRGNRFIGPYQATGAFNLNDLIGRNDRTGLRIINTVPLRDLHYGELSHEEPIGDEGTKLAIGGFYTESRPGASLQGLHNKDYSIWAQATHPFIRSRTENLMVRARVEVSSFDGELGPTLVSDDDLRVLRLQVAYDRADTLWLTAANQAAVELSQGIDAFGARTLNARPGTDPSFTKVAASVSREQPLFDRFSMLVASAGQYSQDILPVSELFGFGGAQFGRGYDFSEIVGDSGFAAKAELRYTEAVNGGRLQAWQAYTFFDAGVVWNNAAFVAAKRQTATSTGVGLRATFDYNISGYVELGVPLTRKVAAENDKSPRAFFGAQMRF